MKVKSFQMLTLNQWGWMLVAYWRLWMVWIRIKFKQGNWLKRKVLVQQPLLSVEIPVCHPKWLAMHESVRLAARLHLVSMACLPRSIVLADMLRIQGDRATVRIGVNRAGMKLASHAWVEVDGCMIGEPEHVSEQFALLNL